jgi:hypothetical protein
MEGEAGDMPTQCPCDICEEERIRKEGQKILEKADGVASSDEEEGYKGDNPHRKGLFAELCICGKCHTDKKRAQKKEAPKKEISEKDKKTEEIIRELKEVSVELSKVFLEQAKLLRTLTEHLEGDGEEEEEEKDIPPSLANLLRSFGSGIRVVSLNRF